MPMSSESRFRVSTLPVVSVVVVFLGLALAGPLCAETRRVPQDFPNIQAAIDASSAGDTILVSPAEYREPLRLTPGLTLRAVPGGRGDEDARPVIDLGGAPGTAPGIEMAEGCVLDGFEITGVGAYDEETWKRHHETQGEELGDDEGSVQAEGTVPAIRAAGVACTITNCVVHHNGDVGIALQGKVESGELLRVAGNRCFRNMGGGIGIALQASPLVSGNECYENLRAGIGCRAAAGIIEDNFCHSNVRAGIGCREGATPIIRANRCVKNRRAGIGIRMPQTRPVVIDNECAENAMAGIGSRDEAAPIIQGNHCHHNQLAGIGSSNGTRPLIVKNRCIENGAAGIGLDGNVSAILLDNECVDNSLVAIGVTNQSQARIERCRCERTGNMPPLIAIRGGSRASIVESEISGGGVAGVLVEGEATIQQCRFLARNENQGTAIWVWAGSELVAVDNETNGYRSAVKATESAVEIAENRFREFGSCAVELKACVDAVVRDNIGVSADEAGVFLKTDRDDTQDVNNSVAVEASDR